MNIAFAKDFLTRYAQTASARDLDAHMAMISRKVMVHGVPGFDIITYDDWFQQCAHEFKAGTLVEIGFEGLDMKVETETLIAFETTESIIDADGCESTMQLEMFVEKEPDGEWRLVQERIIAQTIP